MKKWIPNEMLTDEPGEGETPNSFQKMVFGLGEGGIIKDPITKEEFEIISDVVAVDDKYVMRFSVDVDRSSFRDEHEDKHYVEVSNHIDVPLEVIGDPSKPEKSQILFDIDKGIDVYSSTRVYDSKTLLERKGDLVEETREDIPEVLEPVFKKFAENLDKSIREVGFDVFTNNIVKEVDEPKKENKKKGGDYPSP